MNTKKLKMMGLALGVGAMLAACSGSDEGEKTTEKSGDSNDSATTEESKKINLAYVEWDTEIASTHVVGKVLEDLGYDVTLTPLDNAIMWEAVANGEADAMVAGWLPHTHASQYEQYKDDLVELGENLSGAKIGLVVPSYMEDVNSIEDLADQANMQITGIEPGAGIMAATEKALTEYENLADWELLQSSSGAMTVALDQAIKNEEEIVVTGWSPHWKFASYDLKYLEDSKGVYGGEETINTFARKGLEEEMPNAFKVIDAFHWTSADNESVMLEINAGVDPEEAAAKWVEENAELVAEWTKGIE
ncbi:MULTISPECIES: glycine betaine ABC transporter substrate-binding protein [Lysinibacillus]|uniref:Glycine betaine ABC transporter substrate-binding protein n=1 Tax=Lysinibacillus antri TaxID=2498145 RepID=A0A3S0R6P2_9BACI|nr:MULTISPECIES: glycine betaine ABC transporter substrate-binding protein [Lysinibacillus]RUL53600.1 glycine betaine ABC transporter substrate-binding protein [Lysinibacillus antri]TSI06170.1 glycine betaine ABC transporter substrate-binding protein [Lysinibacillus sp. BW-2-10]